MKFRNVDVQKVSNGWVLEFADRVATNVHEDLDWVYTKRMVAKTREGVFEFLDKYLVNTRPVV